jgi:hypothetical protein
MSEEKITHTLTNDPQDVPVPIVTFSRWIYFIFLLGSIITRFELGISILFILLLPGVIAGKKWNIIGRIGKSILKKRLAGAQFEDRQLIRFNNIILLLFLVLAQIAFFTGFKITGWVITSFAIAANGLALAGFCIGCVFYFQFKLYRYKFFGQN